MLKNLDDSIGEKMIKIYTKEDCGACEMAKTILNENNISYKEIKITPQTIEENNLTCAPTILCGINRIDGYPGAGKLLSLIKQYEQKES